MKCVLPKLVLRALHVLVLAAVLGMVARDAGAALPAAQPWMQRVLGNGQEALVFDHAHGKLSDWWVRPYKAAAPGKITSDILYDAYWGIALPSAGKGAWAPELPLVHANGTPWQQSDGTDDSVFGYIGAAGVVADNRAWPTVPGLRLTTWAFAPQTCAGRCAVVLGQIHNGGAAALDIAVALLPNVHLGAGAAEPGTQGESLQVSQGALVESGPAGTVTVLPIAPAGAAQATLPCTNNLYADWKKGAAACSTAPIAAGDDRIGALLTKVTLPPGADIMAGAVLGFSEPNQPAVSLGGWLAGRAPAQVLADELQWWQTWHALDKLPATLGEAEQLWFQRSLAVLKMAQSRQPNVGAPGQGTSPFGQIVASMPPGIWNITWPRDQSYAGVALATTGHPAEARDALDFALASQPGQFVSEVGAPYRISVTRWWGGGAEESDSNDQGPNIELDGFGLVLWQAAKYLDNTQDLSWLAVHWPVLRDEVAAPLVQAVDWLGLIKPDSSIWEVHWNGNQKHFAYTSMQAVRGLCGAAKLATLAGQGTLAASYRKSAQGVAGAVAGKMVAPTGELVGNLEESPSKARDLAAIEALTDGQLPAWGKVAQASWQVWKSALLAGGGPGFMRNDDGGAYDSQEWLFIDLRVLRWMDRAIGQGAQLAADRQALAQRVLQIAQAGGGLLPELIGVSGPDAGQFSGAIPMMGFGAGVALLYLAGDVAGDDLTACLAGSTPGGGETGDAAAASDLGSEVAPADTALDAALHLDPGSANPVVAGKSAPKPADSGCSAPRRGPGPGGTVGWLAAAAVATWLRRTRNAS